jgi:hypothetical protein
MKIRLPIFPLDNVVLLPRVQVPLYIFEPRYRQMAAAAIDGDGRIGMVVVQPQHREDMAGDPPVFEIGCEGSIEHAEPRPDGTYHLILQGIARFRIREELPRSPEGERLYRVARVERLEDEVPDGDALAPMRRRILELMRAVAPDRSEQFTESTFAKLDDTTFVNAFCQSLDFDVIEKQQLLEANGVRGRAEQLVGLMEFRIAERDAARTPGSGTVH